MLQIQSVKVESKPVGGEVPLAFDDILTKKEILEMVELNFTDMGDPGRFESLAEPLIEEYQAKSPISATIGSALTCFARGAMVSGKVDGKRTYYTYERGAARDPEHYRRRYGHYPRIYCTYGGSRYVAFTMKSPGRAGGKHGWDKLGIAIAGVLASFKHNFEVLCSAIFDMPRLNCNEEWRLPNMVLDPEIARRERAWNSQIKEPKQFVLPAKYYFAFAVPVPFMTFRIGTKASTPIKYDVLIWDSRNHVAVKQENIELEKGENEVIINVVAGFPGMTKGYISIEPTDAPKGLTVSYVNVFPPPVP